MLLEFGYVFGKSYSRGFGKNCSASPGSTWKEMK
jgi:hypothetical protein